MPGSTDDQEAELVQVHAGALRPGPAAALPLAPADDGDLVIPALELARGLGVAAPLPGDGDTLGLWDLLSRTGAADLTTARVVEPHLDALAILAQAPQTDEVVAARADTARTWGVFAAEGAQPRLAAVRDGDGWSLTGRKPWCSLAGRLSHALVTAWCGDGRRLFAVDLRHPGVEVEDASGWVAHGLPQVVSTGIALTGVPGVPVGEQGWYLGRPGFWWGAMGVAACWYGGAAATAARLHPRPGREPDQVALMHLGAADADLFAARAALVHAAGLVDAGQADGPAGHRLALQVRGVVREAADRVLARTARATGPAPLALETGHRQRVADLTLYLGQEHAERDRAALGRVVTEHPDQGDPR